MPRSRATTRDDDDACDANGDDPCAMGALLLLGARDAAREGRGRAAGARRERRGDAGGDGGGGEDATRRRGRARERGTTMDR